MKPCYRLYSVVMHVFSSEANISSDNNYLLYKGWYYWVFSQKTTSTRVSGGSFRFCLYHSMSFLWIPLFWVKKKENFHQGFIYQEYFYSINSYFYQGVLDRLSFFPTL